MGKMIEQIALQRGHSIVAKIDVDSVDTDFSDADVAIDFSTPGAAFTNVTNCFSSGIPVVSGTTGWLDQYDEAVKLCKESNSAFIYASNFSLGVNVFFAMNSYLASKMKELKQYNVAIEEIHHTQKLDAPSGTAITLAEGIIDETPYDGWLLEQEGEKKITINSKREGQVPGTHTITYSSAVDSISLKHKANNREGFALGAIVAAEWILGRKGVFSMKDVLNLG